MSCLSEAQPRTDRSATGIIFDTVGANWCSGLNLSIMDDGEGERITSRQTRWERRAEIRQDREDDGVPRSWKRGGAAEGGWGQKTNRHEEKIGTRDWSGRGEEGREVDDGWEAKREKLTDVGKQMTTSDFEALLILVSRLNLNRWRQLDMFSVSHTLRPRYYRWTGILICYNSVILNVQVCVCACVCAHVFNSGGVDGVERRGGVPFLSMWVNAGTEIHPSDEICSTYLLFPSLSVLCHSLYSSICV